MVNEHELNRGMQIMIDEPIEGVDIFKALNDSKSEGKFTPSAMMIQAQKKINTTVVLQNDYL